MDSKDKTVSDVDLSIPPITRPKVWVGLTNEAQGHLQMIEEFLKDMQPMMKQVGVSPLTYHFKRVQEVAPSAKIKGAVRASMACDQDNPQDVQACIHSVWKYRQLRSCLWIMKNLLLDLPSTEKKMECKTKGIVSGLFVHHSQASRKNKPIQPMIELKKTDFMELVQDKGIVGEQRFWGKARQVSGIETEVVRDYANRLGLQLPPGQLRSNIEFTGIDLLAPIKAVFGEQEYDSKDTKKELLAAKIDWKIGPDAIVRCYQLREPCWVMNQLYNGFEDLIRGKDIDEKIKGTGHLCQGVLFQVVQSGKIRVGDEVCLVSKSS